MSGKNIGFWKNKFLYKIYNLLLFCNISLLIKYKNRRINQQNTGVHSQNEIMRAKFNILKFIILKKILTCFKKCDIFVLLSVKGKIFLYVSYKFLLVDIWLEVFFVQIEYMEIKIDNI